MIEDVENTIKGPHKISHHNGIKRPMNKKILLLMFLILCLAILIILNVIGLNSTRGIFGKREDKAEGSYWPATQDLQEGGEWTDPADKVSAYTDDEQPKKRETNARRRPLPPTPERPIVTLNLMWKQGLVKPHAEEETEVGRPSPAAHPSTDARCHKGKAVIGAGVEHVEDTANDEDYEILHNRSDTYIPSHIYRNLNEKIYEPDDYIYDEIEEPNES
jgi:hypothetical protein